MANVLKANPYHDDKGRFTDKAGSSGANQHDFLVKFVQEEQRKYKYTPYAKRPGHRMDNVPFKTTDEHGRPQTIGEFASRKSLQGHPRHRGY